MAGEAPIRRLTTIVAADVAGFSRLTAADEEATLAALRQHRVQFIDPKIAEYRGRIANTAGDSLLMEFPSVVEALRCALDLQRGMSERNAEIAEEHRIEFRIGINLGDVIEQDGDLLGDGVNVAARLEALAEPGGICLSRAAREQVQDRLDAEFEDLGQIELKNIAQPVHAFRIAGAGKRARPLRITRRPDHWRSGRWLVFAIIAIIIFSIWQYWPRGEISGETGLALPDKPSIAVLPFQNMSGDPEQDYFADGMVEDIITDLSKVSGLFVIARNSSFHYRDKAVDVKLVGRELGVKYVLEGSVRRAGDQVRINAQLIDAQSGGHLWAERYDGTLADVFGLQDQVTGKIVAALSINLTPQERAQTTNTETSSAAAYDDFLRGWTLYRQGTPDVLSQANAYFRKAIELDPDYARAYAAMAALHWIIYRRAWSWALPELAETCGTMVTTHCAFERAKEYVALALKKPTPIAYRVSAAIAWNDWQQDDAVAAAEKALALNGNDPDSHVALAEALVWAGRGDEALGHVERAMRLDPHHPPSYLRALGLVYFSVGRISEAASQFEAALNKNPRDLVLMLWLASALAGSGHVQEARDLRDRFGQTLGGRGIGWSIKHMMQFYPLRETSVARRFGEGLAEAGVCCRDDVEAFIDRMRKEGKMK